MTKGNDLQASNVPGIPGDLYLAGARIERMYGFGPLPGCAAMVAMVTHGAVGCVAVNYDAASFTEPKLWEQAMADGFAQVLDLHPGAGKPVVRT
jgi:diacylglycerol O-acyltransferase